MSAYVLRPRNCLVDQIRVPSESFHHRQKGMVNNGNNNTRSAALRKSKKVDISPNCGDLKKNRNINGLVMGQVTILKRGEPPNSMIKSGSEKPNAELDLVVPATERRKGSEPGPKRVKIRARRSVPFSSPAVEIYYAGSAVSISPSPNSLPLPSFFCKNRISKIVEDSATKELCRILRLD